MMVLVTVEYELVPSIVVWATRNWQLVARSRFVTVASSNVDLPSLNVVQSIPLVEYWTT